MAHAVHKWTVGGTARKISGNHTSAQMILGIGFTLLVAVAGYGLSKLPGLDRIGQMACAILLAVLYRQFAPYPEQLRAGIQFSSKRLLRLAIILFGLKLNMAVILRDGLSLLVLDAGMVVLAVTLTLLLARWFKADPPLSLLLGLGTGICGAAAIAALSPIVKAKEEDTALGAGMIALVGTLFAVTYTLLRPFIGLSDMDYAKWSGVSLHEIAHVALAAAPAGQDALMYGLLAKLGRVMMLIPVSIGLMFWMKHRRTNAAAGAPAAQAEAAKIEVPWFLGGFILMSVLGSYVIGPVIAIPETVLNSLSLVTTFMLTMAMVGLGLNVSLRQAGSAKFRALAAMAAASVVMSLLVYVVV